LTVKSGAVRLVSINLAVEDPEGSVQTVGIYNFPLPLLADEMALDEIFPIGTILGLREPTCKPQLAAGGHSAFIRVDSPSDLVFIAPSRGLAKGVVWQSGPRLDLGPKTPATVAEWKERGNHHFNAGRYLPAAVAYAAGLEMDPAAQILHLNLAQAYIQLDWFKSALLACKTVLGFSRISNTERKKALYRMALANYALGEYDLARSNFASCLELDVNFEDAKNGVIRCRAREKELATGAYNWVQLMNLARSSTRERLDVANFVGPVKIAFGLKVGGGRGLIATREIQVGELLVSAKFFESTIIANG
jgi:tetratricopeptide (TPR) repeat protein